MRGASEKPISEGPCDTSGKAMAPKGYFARIFETSRRLPLALLLLSLLGTNLLSLISDPFHMKAYGLVSSLLPASSLDESPTAARKRELERATAAFKLAKEAADRRAADAALKVASLTASAAAKTQLVKRIATSIARRTVTNVERNVSSVAGEAIPYLGTALVVGVTVWDVKDACDTLSQLDELNEATGGSTASASSASSAETTKVCGTEVPNASQVMSQLQTNWNAAYSIAASALNTGSQMVPPIPKLPSMSEVSEWLRPIIAYPAFNFGPGK